MTDPRDADAFDAAPPPGWEPKAGDDVLYLVGCGPEVGAVVTRERVARVFRWSHHSGRSFPAFVLESGGVCGANSLRPPPAEKTEEATRAGR